MIEWKEIELGSLADIKGGKRLPKGSMLSEIPNSHPYIRTRDINNNSISINELLFVPDETFPSISRYIVEANDVIVSIVGTIGLCSIIPDELHLASLTENCAKIVNVKEDVLDKRYLFYFLTSEDGQAEIESRNVGSTQPKLPLYNIQGIPIPVPPLPEQKAIAAVLSSLDDKIDLLHRQNKTLESMAETLFRQMFVEQAQEDWEEKPLDEVLKIAIGRTPPRKEFHWFSSNESDVKWISIKDLGESGVFVFDTFEYLTQEAVENFNIPIIPIDTVILSFKMTVGRVGITTEPMLSNEAIAHFKFNENTPFSKEYLYIFLKTFKYASLGSTSSIVTAINSSMIKEIEIIVPDNSTMNNFQAKTEHLFNKIKKNQSQIRTLEKLRDTLLPKLMSGEVRVKI